jgi:hypothetical protein
MTVGKSSIGFIGGDDERSPVVVAESETIALLITLNVPLAESETIALLITLNVPLAESETIALQILVLPEPYRKLNLKFAAMGLNWLHPLNYVKTKD